MTITNKQSEVLKYANSIGLPTEEISDGDHTFHDLYDHRVSLWIALCKVLSRDENKFVWRSKKYHDGSDIYKDYFLLGLNTLPGTQITYHIPISYWDNCYFAKTLDEAPKFDGHTHDETLERILSI